MFGMSVFQSVLERLKAEEDEEETAERGRLARRRRTVLGAATAASSPTASARVWHARGAVERAYFALAADCVEPPNRSEPMPDYLNAHQPCGSRLRA